MPDAVNASPGRRQMLAAFVTAVAAGIGASLAAVLGAFALKPSRAAASERWVRAGAVEDLTVNVPVPRVVSVPRVDGWYRERARQTVFLLWDGERKVTAFSATCSHLGCQVAWNAEAKQFKCPCHGGVYDINGRVVSGPPPKGLTALSAELHGGDVVVKV
jgi:Rieske Fe-S protein